MGGGAYHHVHIITNYTEPDDVHETWEDYLSFLEGPGVYGFLCHVTSQFLGLCSCWSAGLEVLL